VTAELYKSVLLIVVHYLLMMHFSNMI